MERIKLNLPKNKHPAHDVLRRSQWIENISKARKGQPCSEQTRKTISESCLGRVFSEEHLSKLRGRQFSKSHLENLSKAWEHRVVPPQTPESNLRRSQTLTGTRNFKQRETKRRLNGTGQPLDWRGCAEYNEWRKAVLVRDGYTCQHCGITEVEYKEVSTTDRGLHAHHIKPGELFPELRYDVSNGLTLCSCCHASEEQKLSLAKLRSNN